MGIVIGKKRNDEKHAEVDDKFLFTISACYPVENRFHDSPHRNKF